MTPVKKLSYKWRDGTRFKKSVDPQAVGERLEQLKKSAKGFLTPDAVVEDARSRASPLHSAFEWNDDEAAQQFRLQVARTLINSIRVVVILENNGQEVEERQIAYVHVRPGEEDNSDPAYVSVDTLKVRDDFREQVLEEALAYLKGFRNRYREISELSGVMREIDKALERVEKTRPPKVKPRERQVRTMSRVVAAAPYGKPLRRVTKRT